MKINWKQRFRNKVWLLTFITTIVGFVYTILGMFGIAPVVSQEQLLSAAGACVMFLSLIGVVVDGTTPGTNDSDRAMSYGKFDFEEVDSMGSGKYGSEVE